MIIATMTSIIVQRVWRTIRLFHLVPSFVCYYVIVTEAAVPAQLANSGRPRLICEGSHSSNEGDTISSSINNRVK
jgi:hypothetical protein